MPDLNQRIQKKRPQRASTATTDVSKSRHKPRRSQSFYAPQLYRALIGVTIALSVLPFYPAFEAAVKTGRWYLNPVYIKMNKLYNNTAHGNESSGRMNFHIILSFLWLLVALSQFFLSPPKAITGRWRTHSYIGYFGVFIMFVFSATGIWMVVVSGVEGKLTNNAFAVVVGSALLYHVPKAIAAIKNGDRATHICQMIPVLVWVAFPGIARLVFHTLQLYALPASCSVSQTAGAVTVSGSISAGLIAGLRYAALGPGKDTVGTWSDYTVWIGFVVFDIFLGVIDSSLFQCSPLNEGLGFLGQPSGGRFVLYDHLFGQQ